MTLVLDIASKLIELGFGTALGNDIWPTKHLPSEPLNLVAIIPLAIKEPDWFDANGAIDYPAFSIQVRNTDYETAEANAEAIRRALDGVAIPGYVRCKTTRSRATDVTSQEDLAATNGPVYRFSCDFELIQVR
jgi:hypothetical protein